MLKCQNWNTTWQILTPNIGLNAQTQDIDHDETFAPFTIMTTM